MSKDAIPMVIVDEAAQDQGWSLDAVEMAQCMESNYGVSSAGVLTTTIVVSGENHFVSKGSEAPKWFDRILHGRSDANEGSGSIIRISTLIKGVERSADEANETLAHELEHTAQADRHDANKVVGNVVMWGLGLSGALLGSRLGRTPVGRLAGTVVGFGLGMELGYRAAPHERQARARANELNLPLLRKS